ncbi:hypothetical protein M885DRAFT_542524 [Pelagophyceae sp. CCMP2097]|nr:hypothetical protein M885DRAFT_542524 [Pelagophyceae sp. CCMP2097]
MPLLAPRDKHVIVEFNFAFLAVTAGGAGRPPQKPAFSASNSEVRLIPSRNQVEPPTPDDHGAFTGFVITDAAGPEGHPHASLAAGKLCSDSPPTGGTPAPGITAEAASAVDALAGIETLRDAECVETTSFALAVRIGAFPADHQVVLGEAEYGVLHQKLDAMTDHGRAREIMKNFSCRPCGNPAASARETTTPAPTPTRPTTPTTPAARPPPATSTAPTAQTATAASTPTRAPKNRMQHALHVSALALQGRVVTEDHIQSEVTAACAGNAVCLYYVTGTCKTKTSKCDRLHRRVLIKSAASSGADVCKFYLSETGCLNGTACTFRHFVLPP